MTSSLETIRYHSGIAGEEVADMIDSLEREIISLREQVEKLTEECVVLRASSRSKLETIANLEWQVEKLTKELSVLKTTPPHLRQDLHCVASDLSAQVRERDEQLTAALAACEKKDEALDADNSKLWPSKLREEAISIQPDASALNEYRNQVIEECATCCEEHQGSAQTCANAIRGLKK